jgi:hypothetical protein
MKQVILAAALFMGMFAITVSMATTAGALADIPLQTVRAALGPISR